MNMEPEAIEAMDIDDTFIPQHLRDGIIAYIEIGRPVGNFLEGIICNDLKRAIFSAHPGVLVNVPSIVRWFWNFAPATCHGNENHYRGWIDAKQSAALKESR